MHGNQVDPYALILMIMVFITFEIQKHSSYSTLENSLPHLTVLLNWEARRIMSTRVSSQILSSPSKFPPFFSEATATLFITIVDKTHTGKAYYHICHFYIHKSSSCSQRFQDSESFGRQLVSTKDDTLPKLSINAPDPYNPIIRSSTAKQHLKRPRTPHQPPHNITFQSDLASSFNTHLRIKKPHPLLTQNTYI